MKKHHKHHKAHHEMSGHHDGVKHSAQHAHESHNAANKEMDMHEGIGPEGGYEEGPRDSHLGCNEEHSGHD